jgi:hypothetical protein
MEALHKDGIYGVHHKISVEDTYPRYMTKITR